SPLEPRVATHNLASCSGADRLPHRAQHRNGLTARARLEHSQSGRRPRRACGTASTRGDGQVSDMREYSFGAGAGLEQVLPAEHLHRLSEAGTRIHRLRGECLFRQGDSADSVIILLSGKVKVTFTNAAGQETLIRIHLPGSL